MSDSSVKAGVEDVLSSIRRLVDEEGRKILGASKVGADRKPARLVLTDALRVAETNEASQADSLVNLARDFSVDAFLIREAEFAPVEPANRKIEPMVLKASDRVYPIPPRAQPRPVAAVTPNKQQESRDLAGSLSAKIEALEAAIARTEDQWEPDGISDDAYAGTRTRRIHWDTEAGFDQSDPEAGKDRADASNERDEPETGEAATFVRDRKPQDQNRRTAGVSPDPDPEALAAASVEMDEDALRALITEVVRKELQGALGERITRNIRKLVRREINRALAAQTLD